LTRYWWKKLVVPLDISPPSRRNCEARFEPLCKGDPLLRPPPWLKKRLRPENGGPPRKESAKSSPQIGPIFSLKLFNKPPKELEMCQKEKVLSFKAFTRRSGPKIF